MERSQRLVSDRAGRVRGSNAHADGRPALSARSAARVHYVADCGTVAHLATGIASA